MDLEAMQLLNLSPIPELSEIELSTMLDHLSGLSDINGDLTDRNVEDIIKEAEDLIDKSISSKTNDSRDKKSSQADEIKSEGISENVMSLKESEESITQQSNSSKMKHQNNPVINDPDKSHNTSNEDENSKHFNSPVESPSTKVYSPGSTTNHIKSTIDSLKEFSTLIEKRFSSQSENSSPKDNTKTKQNEKAYESTQITAVGSPSNEKLIKKQPSNEPKIMKESHSTKKNQPLDKSIKLLNCFERLYQVKPVRLSTSKRPKIVDKTPKTLTKKKLTKDLKTLKKNNWQGKPAEEKIIEDTKNTKDSGHASLPTFIEEYDLLKQSKPSPRVPSNNHNYTRIRNTENKTTDDYITHSHGSLQQSHYGQVPSRIDEKLILKVLEEMEEIKDQVRKVGAIADGQNPGRLVDDGGTNPRKPEVESTERDTLETADGSGIKRLEQQFSVLKEKYDYQMEKLEAENCRLREALSSQEKFFPSGNSETSKTEEFGAENKSLTSLSSCRTDKKITRSMSLDNCRAPKNSPCSSFENIHGTGVKEAFSQTEQDAGKSCREVGTEAEIFPETRKTENKENVTLKKRQGKCKPFSDVNVHQSARLKKIDDHESQLLATLRGLQAELTAKDKENRKLKSEIETLKKQTKKPTSTKIENWRKCHSGTQTIGLGPIVQKPYVPEQYEVPQEFEKENEDLRSRIKALEEDFELLKEKRISDLQALHQVHEEEMAKLVSKLETQSALTRHLHSLLVNR